MMKSLILPCFFFLSIGAAARAQVVPQATSTGSTTVGQKLNYALRYSETGQFGSSISNSQSSTTSGSIGVGNQNQHLPFSLNYAGGYTWTLTGTPYNNGQFHHLNISQGIDSHKWKLLLVDDVSYLPQSPTTGFSGVSGIGDPIGGTAPTPPSPRSIQTLNTHAITNQASGELSYVLSNAMGFSVGGDHGLLLFPNNDGLDTYTLSANAKFIKHFNTRNLVHGDYQFSRFTYPGYTSVSFETNTAQIGYQRLWTRNLTTDISAGPSWIGSSIPQTVPPSTTFAAIASLNYILRFASASASYVRGINGGAGYLIGGQFDSVTGNLGRDFTPNLNVGLSGGFDRTTGLNGNTTTSTSGPSSHGATNSTFGGAEATWRLGQRIIVFANYTATNQTSSSALPNNALNQLLQQVGFGVGFSPRQSQRKR